MKIIVEKIYNKEDIYQFPAPQKRYMKKDEIPKPRLTHKKGELVRQKQKVGEYCCKKMKNQIDEFIEIPETFSGFASIEEQMGCYIMREPEYDEDEERIHISYCPFCGEKIEMIVETEKLQASPGKFRIVGRNEILR